MSWLLKGTASAGLVSKRAFIKILSSLKAANGIIHEPKNLKAALGDLLFASN